MEETLGQSGSGLRVVLFGPESTGKTTMARTLAGLFEVPWVEEYMRRYLEERGPVEGPLVSREEILPIAKGQMGLENRAMEGKPGMIICDTNLLELLVYCQYYFDGWCPDQLTKAVQAMHYDHYFLTQVDTPWEPDNLRDRPLDRVNMFRTFERELTKRNLPYTILEGPHSDRLEKAQKQIEQLKTDHYARRKRR